MTFHGQLILDNETVDETVVLGSIGEMQRSSLVFGARQSGSKDVFLVEVKSGDSGFSFKDGGDGKVAAVDLGRNVVFPAKISKEVAVGRKKDLNRDVARQVFFESIGKR